MFIYILFIITRMWVCSTGLVSQPCKKDTLTLLASIRETNLLFKRTEQTEHDQIYEGGHDDNKELSIGVSLIFSIIPPAEPVVHRHCILL
jgi:hypothetical protein